MKTGIGIDKKHIARRTGAINKIIVVHMGKYDIITNTAAVVLYLGLELRTLARRQKSERARIHIDRPNRHHKMGGAAIVQIAMEKLRPDPAGIRCSVAERNCVQTGYSPK